MIYGAGQTVSGVLGVHELGYAPSVEDGAILGIPVKYAKIQRTLICNGGAKDARRLVQKLQVGGALVIGGEDMGTGWECTAATGDESGKVTAEFRRILTPFDMLPGGWGMVLDATAKTATLTFNGTPKWGWTKSGANYDFRWSLSLLKAPLTGKFTEDDVFPVDVVAINLKLGGVDVLNFNPLWKFDGTSSGGISGGTFTYPLAWSGSVSVDSGLTEAPVIMYWDSAAETWRTKLRYTYGYYQDIFREKALQSALSDNDLSMDSAIDETGESRGVARAVFEFGTWEAFARNWPTLTATVTLSKKRMGNRGSAQEWKKDAATNGVCWIPRGVSNGITWDLVYFGSRFFSISDKGSVEYSGIGGSAVS